MPIIPPGTPVAERLIFNSGYIDFGSNRLVDIDSATLTIAFTEKDLRILTSIKEKAHRRSTLKVDLKFKVKSMSHEVYAALLGTTTVDGAGELISITDGQAPTLNPVFTTYVNDNNADPIQFQFIDAFVTSIPLNVALEAFGEVDITLNCRDVNIFYFE